ncbi:MAG TPA: anthranilate phosphoribosyltransferase [Minicystis sp.]|nr:anthranilate phosphoribosyltransferase [Minicystis sp.]
MTARFAEVFEELASPAGPSPATIRRAFDAILAGAWTPVQVAGFAVALRLRGESAAVITAAVESLRAVMVPVEHGLPVVVDTCGTGGDGKGTLNVSTAAAIVVAAAGLPVAKHGNRSVSSRAGSADVLEALGVPLDVPAERQADLLRRANIAFLFAPAHHPAMRHGGVARRELAIRTVFNALGPIANPARATHQLVGTYDDALREILGETLAKLGTRRAWIVRGEDGLDELSPFGPTRVTELAGGGLSERSVAPDDFGLAPSPAGALDGGDAAENAARIRSVLRGEADPARDAIAMNAAAAIAIAREDTSAAGLRSAAEDALSALRSGAALATFERWRDAAREAKGT